MHFWQLVVEKCFKVSYLISGIKVLHLRILAIIKLHVASRKGCYKRNDEIKAKTFSRIWKMIA